MVRGDVGRGCSSGVGNGGILILFWSRLMSPGILGARMSPASLVAGCGSIGFDVRASIGSCAINDSIDSAWLSIGSPFNPSYLARAVGSGA